MKDESPLPYLLIKYYIWYSSSDETKIKKAICHIHRIKSSHKSNENVIGIYYTPGTACPIYQHVPPNYAAQHFQDHVIIVCGRLRQGPGYDASHRQYYWPRKCTVQLVEFTVNLNPSLIFVWEWHQLYISCLIIVFPDFFFKFLP